MFVLLNIVVCCLNLELFGALYITFEILFCSGYIPGVWIDNLGNLTVAGFIV